jgi:hypothetical protein
MRERTLSQIAIQTLTVEILAFRYINGPLLDERIIAKTRIENRNQSS